MAYGKVKTSTMNKRRYMKGRYGKRVKTDAKKTRRGEDRRLTQDGEI